MAVEKIQIEINESGEINVDLNGFKGQGCGAIMDLIEQALGRATRKNKPEYDQRGVQKVTETAKIRNH